MTREEFIEVLEEKGCSYMIEDDKIVVIHDIHVYLNSLRTLPSGVEFKNEGDVFLGLLKTLPSGVEFNNMGDVDLDSLETIHPGVEFKNRGDVWLRKLIGCWLSKYGGLISGIRSKTLLNSMIKRGIFSR
jgi:hypothetical protein